MSRQDIIEEKIRSFEEGFNYNDEFEIDFIKVDFKYENELYYVADIEIYYDNGDIDFIEESEYPKPIIDDTPLYINGISLN